MEAEGVQDLRAKAIEARQADLERAAHSSVKAHELDAQRLKASRLIHSQLLDYKHNSPSSLKKCVGLLMKLCGNIVDHPLEEKFRKVRAATSAFDKNVAAHAPALQLLSLVGWRAMVVDCEKHWTFEHGPDSQQFQLLKGLLPELSKAMAEVEKKEQALLDPSDRKAEDQRRREAALRHIQDDYEARKLVQERQRLALQAAEDAAKAKAASEAAQAAQRAAAQHEEEEEDEEGEGDEEEELKKQR